MKDIITGKYLFIITVIITIVASFSLTACNELTDISKTMDSFEVVKGDIIQTVNTSGSVGSSEQNDYPLSVSGKVLHALSKGDTFSKGDVLIKIDDSRQELLIAQAEENLNTGRHSLKLAKISYQQALDANHIAIQLAGNNMQQAELAAENAFRALENANNMASKSMRDSAEGTYEQSVLGQSTAYWNNFSSTKNTQDQIKITKENIEQAETQLKLSEINLELAKLDMDSSIIHAPYDGIVSSSSYKEGQNASPGVNAISIISDDFIIRADINEIDVINLQVGQDVDIRLDAYYENEFSGKIVYIAPIPTSIGGVVSYELIVKPEAGEGPELLYGLSASLAITTSGIKNVLYVPIQSVYEEDGKSYVDFVVEGANIEKTEVTIGAFNYDFIEIKSGLKEGDNILISPAQNNIPGALGF
ncbi:MAG: efflux RND transporter periplasmic adaptor subunit [Actinomycetia bacterium]|nr:efflux RND transporter periplasmic adaptor subunit [Actinomycetes bacterium]